MAGFDTAMSLATTLRMLTTRLGLPPIPVILGTDSKSLYECLIRLGTTDEKRLMINVMAIREAYKNRDITEIGWINGKDKPQTQ